MCTCKVPKDGYKLPVDCKCMYAVTQLVVKERHAGGEYTPDLEAGRLYSVGLRNVVTGAHILFRGKFLSAYVLFIGERSF